MPPRARAFLSHISEETSIALALKDDLVRDFLRGIEVYVSSDLESIAAGEDWLTSVGAALQDAALLLMLCSPVSIRRPWINFELGAAWALGKPIVPICHAGLTPRELPVPLSLRQGIALDDADGLRRLYQRIAEVVSLDVPGVDFRGMAQRLSAVRPTVGGSTLETPVQASRVEDDRGAWPRLRRSLSEREPWRSLERVAIEAGISKQAAADLLREKEEVRFSRGRDGQIIVGLTARVGSR